MVTEASSGSIKDVFSNELDILYQQCCDEDAATSAAATTTAIADLPPFTLSPSPSTPTPTSPPHPPASPTLTLPTALLVRIGRLQALCAAECSAVAEGVVVLYEVLLARLLRLLPAESTGVVFRLAVVELLGLLMLSPAVTAASCQSFFSPHLYRLSSLLLPPSLLSSSVATALLRLVDSLLASPNTATTATTATTTAISRSVCINVRKYVEGWKEDRTRRTLLKQQHTDTATATAYFAPGGAAHQPPAAERAEAGAEEGEGGGVVVAGKKRRRIEPDASVAALFPPYPAAGEEEDKRATALIEALRAEQKVGLTDKKLRAKGESVEDEWRREWRRWMDDEDDDDAEQLAEAADSGDSGEMRKQRFWRRWEEGTEWTRFLPSSLAESKPRSNRPAKRGNVEAESKETAAMAVEDDDIPLSAAERAQVEAAANGAAFSSMFFVPPPIVAAPPLAHHVHPSRAAAAAAVPFSSVMGHQMPMGQPFIPPFVPPPFMPPPFVPPFVPHEQSLHHPFVPPPHAFRGGMHR